MKNKIGDTDGHKEAFFITFRPIDISRYIETKVVNNFVYDKLS